MSKVSICSSVPWTETEHSSACPNTWYTTAGRSSIEVSVQGSSSPSFFKLDTDSSASVLGSWAGFNADMSARPWFVQEQPKAGKASRRFARTLFGGSATTAATWSRVSRPHGSASNFARSIAFGLCSVPPQ
jgi:hypothetical protein